MLYQIIAFKETRVAPAFATDESPALSAYRVRVHAALRPLHHGRAAVFRFMRGRVARAARDRWQICGEATET